MTLAIVLAIGAGTTVLVVEGMLPLATTRPTLPIFVLEVAGYVLLFDAYFYGLHRLLHTRPLYRRVHAAHHRSTAPTVLTGLAFHPLEALLIIAFLPAALWLVPIHLISVGVVTVFLSGSILLAHCGREVFPVAWQRSPWLRWYVTPRVHEAHHRRRTCNYGATLALFDQVFGTLRRDGPATG
jgi:Delta7-sterol 5-desaturase